MSSRPPAFQFYTGDWRKDPAVQALDHEHKGVWIDLLCILHDSPKRGELVLPNGAPMPDDAISRNLSIPEDRWKQIRSKLVAYGVASEKEDGTLYNRRMVREEAIRRRRAEAGRKGGRKSRPPSSGSKAKAKGEAKRPASSSSSTSTSTTESVPDSSKSGPISSLWEAWVDELGGDPPHPSLSTKRRQKLQALWVEQLEDRSDPIGTFREMLRAIKRSDFHMSKRAYQMPESTFANTERRERWLLEATTGGRRNGSDGGGSAGQTRREAPRTQIASGQGQHVVE